MRKELEEMFKPMGDFDNWLYSQNGYRVISTIWKKYFPHIVKIELVKTWFREVCKIEVEVTYDDDREKPYRFLANPHDFKMDGVFRDGFDSYPKALRRGNYGRTLFEARILCEEKILCESFYCN